MHQTTIDFEQQDLQKMNFPTEMSAILARIDKIDPVKYGKTRNFINGAVTYLSPYISRGVISTKQVMAHVLEKGYDNNKIEKFLQELAWRDYWQQIWIAKGDAIDSDLKRPQPRVQNHKVPTGIVEHRTGIVAVDAAIEEFYKTGYLHNHVRMYISAIACNIGQSHWFKPAQWMYYHLLDADWASNALSWQWSAGANAGKIYVANQENINKYCHTAQTDTFLDVPYAAFEDMEIPAELSELTDLALTTPLPPFQPVEIDATLPTYIYNFYNLDPNWNATEKANRILLLEPSHFERYPVGQNSIDFILALSKNIEGLQVFVGEFDDLAAHGTTEFVFKEHPTAQHYRGRQEERDWMFGVTGYFSSFFGFWKKCKKELA